MQNWIVLGILRSSHPQAFALGASAHITSSPALSSENEATCPICVHAQTSGLERPWASSLSVPESVLGMQSPRPRPSSAESAVPTKGGEALFRLNRESLLCGLPTRPSDL